MMSEYSEIIEDFKEHLCSMKLMGIENIQVSPEVYKWVMEPAPEKQNIPEWVTESTPVTPEVSPKKAPQKPQVDVGDILKRAKARDKANKSRFK